MMNRIRQLVDKAQKVTDSVQNPEQAQVAIKYIMLTARAVTRHYKEIRYPMGPAIPPTVHMAALDNLQAMANRLKAAQQYWEQLAIREAVSQRRQMRMH